MPDVPFERRDSFRFFAFEEDIGGAQGAPPLHLIMRHSFDAALLKAAVSAGVMDFTGCSGVLDPAAPSVDLGHRQLKAPVVVAADGVNSPTARLLFGEAFDRGKIGFALEVERPGVDPETDLRIDFGAAAWGYGWQFPKTCGTTIGVGGVLARNADMKSMLQTYLKTLGVTDTLKPKGQFLPFGAFRRVPGKGRILLAGDAAGLVDPVTGEGIAHAMHSGALAARSVAQALNAGRPDTALSRYRRALKPIHISLGQARMLRHIMFREALRPTFIRSFRRSRTLKTQYLQLLAGETEYGTILQQMALRMPGFLWRAIRGI